MGLARAHGGAASKMGQSMVEYEPKAVSTDVGIGVRSESFGLCPSVGHT